MEEKLDRNGFKNNTKKYTHDFQHFQTIRSFWEQDF